MADSILILIIVFVVVFIAGIVASYIRKLKVDLVQNEAIKNLDRRVSDLINLMGHQLKEIRGDVDHSSKVMLDQVRSFTKETTQLRENLKQIQEKVKDVSSFQDIFRSPKLRGQWGEASLEHILNQHFPAELYISQYRFSSGERVDAILKLPNTKLLPIDAKFSSDNFERMVRATEDDKPGFRQKFLSDVKLRIEEIASKYILPSENTVDFALMYIPAEAIYYEIMFNLREEDIPGYAWARKVVLTSPNTIYLTLRTIEHWFRDTQITRQTQEILKRLNRINIDAQKLNRDFRKLGSHLQNAVSAYDSSEKRLSLFSDRVGKLLETKEPKKLK